MTPLNITAFTYTTCLGLGNDANWQAIARNDSALKPCDFFDAQDLKVWIGEVDLSSTQLPDSLKRYDCRNNLLAWAALQQDDFLAASQKAVAKYGATRVAVLIGTSTSGIHETEKAYLGNTPEPPSWYRYQNTHNVYSCADFISEATGARGPSWATSTACSSSAKVFASAHRLIESDLCDAVIVGGVDSLCLTTLYGFNSLQLMSPEPCTPYDANRQGINIGEGAGFALLEKQDSACQLVGFGESSDAYHMSSPHPDGLGAKNAMLNALNSAQLAAEDIGYINLHGTGTKANDSAEGKAVHSLFGEQATASSTKGWTGHTLGACGIIESCISLQAMRYSTCPLNKGLKTVDTNIAFTPLLEPALKPVRTALSNSFGFGGSNCSLVFRFQ